jgi:exonuclease SbcD
MFMKIIHTSDWHIGREFENESLAETQMQFVAWLAGEVRARQVDLVIVAGDVWDRAKGRGRHAARRRAQRVTRGGCADHHDLG